MIKQYILNVIILIFLMNILIKSLLYNYYISVLTFSYNFDLKYTAHSSKCILFFSSLGRI